MRISDFSRGLYNSESPTLGTDHAIGLHSKDNDAAPNSESPTLGTNHAIGPHSKD